MKDKLGDSEYKGYSWDKYERGDPSFLFELLPRIAYKRGELATALGLGTGHLLERWGIPEQDWQQDPKIAYWKMGHPKHHSAEDAGQCGVIINTQYNRDAQCHSHSQFYSQWIAHKGSKASGFRDLGLPGCDRRSCGLFADEPL